VKPAIDLHEAIEALARALAPAIARAVVAELQAGSLPDQIDQHASPLGPRRHVKAIRDGKLPGVNVGRRWLARREDVDQYVAMLANTKPKHSPKLTPEEALAAELGIELEGRH
jgi:excisionase family DNA binding protein